jgi:hypothetical protein
MKMLKERKRGRSAEETVKKEESLYERKTDEPAL